MTGTLRDALKTIRRPAHLSWFPPLLVLVGVNALPLALSCALGGAWILWLDEDAWSVRGHPELGWSGGRLLFFDLLLHWLPLAVCLWWTSRGSPVALWTALLAVAYLPYLIWVEGTSLRSVYSIRDPGAAFDLAAMGLVAGMSMAG